MFGTITDRDITVRATAQGRDPKKVSVRDTMTSDLFYIFEDQQVEEAAHIMQEKQIRRLPVLSRDMRLVGIISLGDLALEAQDRKLTAKTLEHVSRPS